MRGGRCTGSDNIFICLCGVANRGQHQGILHHNIIIKYPLLQECGAVAASLSLTSLFPHSGVKTSGTVSSPAPVCPGTESQASHNNNLATIMEDENNVGNSTSTENKENEGYFEDSNGEFLLLTVK